MKMRNGLRYPLNIQMFAENGGQENDGQETGGQETPKTYSEEEYNKLKSAFDKASADLSNAKKSLKDKQSDEEKKAEEEKQKELEHQSIVKELKQLKIAKELASGGYSDDEISKISSYIIEGNESDLCKYLSTLRKSMVETITKQAQEEFRKSSKLPNGAGGEEESYASKKAKSFSKQEEKPIQWGQFNKQN